MKVLYFTLKKYNIMSNATKSNNVVKFIDIEKKVTTMSIGTKCTVAKYYDGKNSYIGLKVGKTNVFSMYHLKNENANNGIIPNVTNGFTIGCTNDLFTVLSNEYKNNTEIQFLSNDNRTDKTRPNNIVTQSLKMVYELYQFVLNHFTTPKTATTETK